MSETVRKVFKEVEVGGKKKPLSFLLPGSRVCLQASVPGPHGGRWKLWCLTRKTCSKQSLRCPVAAHRADGAPLKSRQRLAVKAVGFGSDAKSIIITLWLILLIPVLSSNPLTEKENIQSLLVKTAAKH